jgi:phage regulator Rha-like protein
LNKNKTIWENLETNQPGNTGNIKNLNVGGNIISDHQQIAHVFNKYRLTIAESINTTQNEHISHNSDSNIPLHSINNKTQSNTTIY